MSDMEILSQMMKDSALVCSEGSADRPRVILRESQAPDSSATISHLPSDALVIKVDSFRSPDGVFNGSKGECKRSDFVIISQKKKCIVHIELKRTKDSLSQIIKQLAGSQCFIKYCQEIGMVFWEQKDFLSGYEHRFVSIGHTSISKRSTRYIHGKCSNVQPKDVLKISWPKNIQYNMLVGA